jgi:hypothetical protein
MSVRWSFWRREASASLCASMRGQELGREVSASLVNLQVMFFILISTLLLMIALASLMTSLTAERTVSICISTPTLGDSVIPAFNHRPSIKSEFCLEIWKMLW